MLALMADATTLSCSRAAGRYTSTETSSGRCPPFFSQLASLPEAVVLPEPCRPVISTTVGGCEANLSLAVSLPRVSTSSSRTILMTCSPGESAVSTSCPTALAWMRSMRSLTTLKLTSASSSARRICFIASAMFSSVRTACPRRDLEARWSFSWRFSNIRGQHYFSRREDGTRNQRDDCVAVSCLRRTDGNAHKFTPRLPFPLGAEELPVFRFVLSPGRSRSAIPEQVYFRKNRPETAELGVEAGWDYRPSTWRR